MKAFALIFAFVPIFLVYAGIGDIRNAPVFETLLLLWLCVEVCTATFWYHADISDAECRADLAARIRTATSDSELQQRVSALIMFDRRLGAA